nr:hypothetical protein [Tanacetum cinerariifolium]
MDHQYPTVAKIPVLDIGKFKQCDSYVVPANTTDTTGGDKSGRTLTLTAEDMQRKKNDVKARTTLLLSLPDEHQLRFQTKHSSRNEDGNIASIPTASTNVPTASASVATISQDTTCAYIASQSSGSQIKFKDINQIDEDDMEEMDIKWNMALLSMRADKLNASTVTRWVILQESARLLEAKTKEEDWSYMANNEEDHASVTDEVAPTEFALMANTSAETKKLETLQQEKEGVDGKLACLLTASKDLDNLIESQRSEKNKEGLGYTVVPPPTTQLYLSPKKDLS